MGNYKSNGLSKQVSDWIISTNRYVTSLETIEHFQRKELNGQWSESQIQRAYFTVLSGVRIFMAGGNTKYSGQIIKDGKYTKVKLNSVCKVSQRLPKPNFVIDEMVSYALNHGVESYSIIAKRFNMAQCTARRELMKHGIESVESKRRMMTSEYYASITPDVTPRTPEGIARLAASHEESRLNRERLRKVEAERSANYKEIKLKKESDRVLARNAVHKSNIDSNQPQRHILNSIFR